MIKKIAAVSLAAMLAAGCAGRSANPVAEWNATDRTITCDEISAEIASNAAKADALQEEVVLKAIQNTAAAATSFLILPLFAMDFQEAAVKEKRALLARNVNLESLYRNSCPATTEQAAK